MSGVAERLAAVRARIATACQRCGRDPATVALLAVSKRQAGEAVRAASAAGQRLFGENRVQELVAKARELRDLDAEWHMVGSLQTNKVRELLAGVPELALLHSLDRRKLANQLQIALDDLNRELDVLMQIDATGEDSKHGVEPERAGDLLRHVLAACPRLRPRGLMAMGPLRGDPAPVFVRVARLREDLCAQSGLELPLLSLGMTGDLDAALAAGSTMVRIGTGVFGPRPVSGA